jgi:hypothetical protein
MKMVPENSLCSYLKQLKMSSFFFYKIEEQEGGTGSSKKRGAPVEGGIREGNGERG